MNSTVNPEVEVADRVAALMGTTLTEADVHRFLLDAADTLGTESFAVYGPDLFFRWRLGERIVEIEPDYRPLRDEYELTVNSSTPPTPSIPTSIRASSGARPRTIRTFGR